MGKLIYTIAAMLIIGWVVGFFVFHIGPVIHALLVIAIVLILFRVVEDRKIL